MPIPPRTALLPLAAVLLLTASGMALSQNPAAPNAAASLPVISDDSIDDFAELNRNLANLAAKVGKAQNLVKAGQDPNGPVGQRAAFRKSVAALLAAFGDGGDIVQLGQSALDFVHQKLAAAEQIASFPPAQKEALVTRWRRIAAQIETAVATLENTRKELAEKLQILQAQAEFVDQMTELRQARAVRDAIGDLGDQRQAVSERIKDMLAGKTTAPDM